MPDVLRRHLAHGSPVLRIVPLSFRSLCAYVTTHHRHHKAPRGGKVFIGVVDAAGTLQGVATLGRPSARAYDDGTCFEVTRSCVEGLANANSCLYGAMRRIGFAMGYRRGITYLQAGESGASLRAAGWAKVKDLPPRKSWAESSVKLKAIRDVVGTGNIARELWEVRRG
jgi:hypothetical protein